MSITELPPPTTSVLYKRISSAKKAEVVRELSALLGARFVLHTAYDLMLYEYDDVTKIVLTPAVQHLLGLAGMRCGQDNDVETAVRR